MQRFDESGKKLNQSLQRIADLLQEAGSKYQRTEAEQNEIVSSFNKGFGVLG